MLFASSQHWPKLHVVRCGLDSSFLEGPSESPPEVASLVCVGRLAPEKGQILLVQAAARLRDHGVAVEIVFVGDGPSRAVIEREARELEVRDRIRLAGWQGSAEVRRSIMRSRALVSPSFAEGIPVVIMEAMALRRPVIATYVGGVPELVEPGENGWLVPAGSVEALAEAIREALRTPAGQLDEMGSRGRQRVLAQHDLARQVCELEAIFRSAMGEDASPASPDRGR
jgi:glycosyltransferase involved in cell wall biosynthesis